MGFLRSFKDAGKKFCHKLFLFGQRLGLDLLPRHFYSEIPDIEKLSKQREWRRPFSMASIAGTSVADQCDALRMMCPDHVTAHLAERDVHEEACRRNGEKGFGAIEAECLYAFVQTHKPEQIFQVGCGVSTAVCLIAAREAGYTPDIVCVEPYPTAFLTAAANAGEIRLLRTPAQDLMPETLSELRSRTLFFVDSSHTLGPAGEVTRIILEMLPLLKKGAYVHFHDIRFPYDYDRRLLSQALFFQHESPLLHAFLAYNERFRVMVSMSMLHYEAPAVLKQCFPRYVPAGNEDGLETTAGHFPSSLYARVVA
jgi:hypothetical protein